jgi:hypothetical protein
MGVILKAMHFLGEKKIELIDMPEPQIRDDEVLLEMKASAEVIYIFFTHQVEQRRRQESSD